MKENSTIEINPIANTAPNAKSSKSSKPPPTTTTVPSNTKSSKTSRSKAGKNPDPSSECTNFCIHGVCVGSVCKCDQGYTGIKCDQCSPGYYLDLATKSCEPEPVCNATCGVGAGMIQICHHDVTQGGFDTECVDKATAANYLKTSRLDVCGSCEVITSDVLTSLEEFDNLEDAIDSVDPSLVNIVVGEVRALVDEELRVLVTNESVLGSMFPDVRYHANLYRRMMEAFDYPSGCIETTSSFVAAVLVVIITALNIASPNQVASDIAQNLVMALENRSLLRNIFLTPDQAWFSGSFSNAFDACLSIWGQVWDFFGLKVIFNTMKTSSSIELTASEYLSMIAFSVTNGASVLPD